MTTVSDRPAGEVTSPKVDQKMTIVSADGHVGPSLRYHLRDYVEQKHLQDFDEFTDQMEKYRETATAEVLGGLPDDFVLALIERSVVEGLQDPNARLADMDTDGIAADVIFHGGANGEAFPFSMFSLASWEGSESYNHLEGVGAQIYNRWLKDYCSADPNRLIGVGYTTVRDIPEAIKIAQEAKEAGFQGLNFPAPRSDFMSYTNEAWDPFFEACQDLELTLCTHLGGGDLKINEGLAGVGAQPIFAVEFGWLGRRGLWHLILSGAFHKFPRLKFSLTEAWGDWVPEMLTTMDSAYLSPTFGDQIRKMMPLKPSEYFASNCYIGASFMSRQEAEMGIAAGMTSRMMWGCDYPHPEGAWPFSVLSIRKTMAGLPADAVQSYLSETAAKAYNLDLGVLARVGERIGPTFGELMEPYTGFPEGAVSATCAFRDVGFLS